MQRLFPLVLLAACGCAPGLPTRQVPVPPVPTFSEEVVGYPSDKDTVQGVLVRPVGPGPFPAVVVVHGDHGLTDRVRAQARHLADRGYVALAVDLYRGEKVTDPMDAHIMERGLPEDRVLADLKAAVDYLTARAEVRRDAIGIFGCDIGGGFALDAARNDPRLRAVVVCYGRLTTDPALLEPMQASVLGIFAGKDEGIPADTRDRFRAAMEKAGKRLAGLHVYPDRRHGFMDLAPYESPRDADNGELAADAWEKVEAYLDVELKR